MDLLWSPHKLKKKERKNMKHFSPLQIAALAVLTVIVVALAIVAFATGKNLAVPLELPTTTTKPEALDIELAYDEKTFAPLPFSMPTARIFPCAMAWMKRRLKNLRAIYRPRLCLGRRERAPSMDTATAITSRR